MILGFYKLNEQPFGVTPDPRYLYLSASHREALASLQYGVAAGRGFTALIAGPGMGKTTLLFDFLNKARHWAKTAFLFQAHSTPRDLLRSLLEDLGIQDDADDIGHMQRKLNECLIRESREGKRFIVVIDEAQGLDENVLEVVRLLSNFETPREKLLHLILAGQPHLAEMIASPQLVQFRQRISIIARLRPFNEQETQLYIDHRLRVAGYQSARPLFSKQAVAMIASQTEGIPRNINNVCFNAMSLAFVLKVKCIDADVIEEVARDLDLHSLCKQSSEAPNPAPHAVLVKEVSLSVPRTSWLGGWWPKMALSLGLLALLGGELVRTNGQSLNVTEYLSLRTLLRSSSLTPASMVPRIAGVGLESPQHFKYPVDISEAAKAKTLSPPPLELQAYSPEKISSQPVRFMDVQPNQTIFRICMETIGKYDDETRARIRELNPELHDLDQIIAGQKIRVPALGRAASPVARQ
jgi:type II secretory pathway predicted ATPase ExeA